MFFRISLLFWSIFEPNRPRIEVKAFEMFRVSFFKFILIRLCFVKGLCRVYHHTIIDFFLETFLKMRAIFSNCLNTPFTKLKVKNCPKWTTSTNSSYLFSCLLHMSQYSTSTSQQFKYYPYISHFKIAVDVFVI